MQLSTRCFTVYSVLLFLLESSFAQHLNAKLDRCEEALSNLFSFTAKQLLESGGFPQDFIFIPSSDVRQILSSNPGEQLILNRFTFKENHTIKFTVKDPKVRIWPYSDNARIVCRQVECKKAIKAVKSHLRSSLLRGKELTCLTDRPGPLITGSFLEGVSIKLPWTDQRNLIFDAKKTLTYLMHSQQDAVQKHWVATRVEMLEKENENVINYINTTDGTSVAIKLPQLKIKAFRNYIEAAAAFLNEAVENPTRALTLGPQMILSFNKIPKEPFNTRWAEQMEWMLNYLTDIKKHQDQEYIWEEE